MWRSRESLARGGLRDPSEGLGFYFKRGVPPTLGVLFPTPYLENPSKHVVPTSVVFASVPQQWVSSSQLAASAQPDPFFVPASLHTPWARVPFPDTCCFQAQNVSRSPFVSCAPSFSIHAGLSPQPISLLPSTTAQTPPQQPLHVSALAISDPQNPSNCISPFFSPARAVYYQRAKNPVQQMFTHHLTNHPALCHHGELGSRKPVGRFEGRGWGRKVSWRMSYKPQCQRERICWEGSLELAGSLGASEAPSKSFLVLSPTPQALPTSGTQLLTPLFNTDLEDTSLSLCTFFD